LSLISLGCSRSALHLKNMGHLPVLKPAEVVRILLSMGFVEVRQRGSHKQFRDLKGRCTTVPFHQARDISPPLLRQIAKDIGMTAEEFIRSQ
jgi:predicted RNA binding protein YcfA (HicA-like mRNA interferase family)